jgi:hypothetical protein
MLAVGLGFLVGAWTASVPAALVSGAGSAVLLIALNHAGRSLFPDLWMREERHRTYAPTRAQHARGVRWAVPAEHFRQPLINGPVRGRLLVSAASLEFMPWGVQPVYATHVTTWGVPLESIRLIDVWVAPRSYDLPHRRLRIVTDDGQQALFGVEGGADRAAASLKALLGRTSNVGGGDIA